MSGLTPPGTPAGGTAMTTASIFSLHPGTTSINLFDWTHTNDLKIHKMAVEKLTHEFDMEPSNMRNFITEVETKADEVGLSSLFDINVIRTSVTGVVTMVKKHLLKQYGQITLEDVQINTATYLAMNTRNA
jgi:hypothetical protein